MWSRACSTTPENPTRRLYDALQLSPPQTTLGPKKGRREASRTARVRAAWKELELEGSLTRAC
jgi:hypothetical protein